MCNILRKNKSCGCYPVPKRDGVTGDWKRLHNERLSELYSSPNVIGIIKSRTMRCPGAWDKFGGKERCI
jgi:hypothetical protein